MPLYVHVIVLFMYVPVALCLHIHDSSLHNESEKKLGGLANMTVNMHALALLLSGYIPFMNLSH